MRSDVMIRWQRMNRAAKLVLLTFVLLSVGTRVYQFVDPNLPTPASSIEYFLNVNAFAAPEISPFLILFCAGATRHQAFERVRVSAHHELGGNVIWMVQCAAAVALFGFLSWCVVEFSLSGRTWDMPAGLIAMTFAEMLMNTFMELVVIGLVQFMLINAGVSWGKAMSALLLFLLVSNWVFHNWAEIIPDTMFYFLPLVQPTFNGLVFARLLPFAGAVVLLFMANRFLYDHHERLTD
ncbi:MAG: hypothetical protein SOI13_00170 [Bifidobacterium mongoliense]|jgi:hypothetical protein|uniref:hypothetical protein n=1 Tax=Bifidobacterium mongoliense TaxID=518643 RepID=UPI002F352C79